MTKHPEGAEQAFVYTQRVFRKMIKEFKSRKRNEIVFAALYVLHQQALQTYHVLAARSHRKRLRGIGFISGMVLLSALAHAQGVRYDDVALLDTGRPVQGATVTVCASGSTGTPCTPTASIFNDSALSSPITQPGFQSAAQGNFFFYAACGKYDISITGNGITGRTKKDVAIGFCPISTYSAFQSGNITVSNIAFFTPAKGITITRIEVVSTAFNSCTVNPTITLTGTVTTTLTLTTGAFHWDSGAISQNYAANSLITLVPGTAGTCVTPPANLNIIIQYKLTQP
jgi:hypothetical protein